MKARLYLAIFFFILSAFIFFAGFFVGLPIDFLLFVIALLVAYIYGLVGLLFLALYLKDGIWGL